VARQSTSGAGFVPRRAHRIVRHHQRRAKNQPRFKLLRKMFAWGIRERLLTSTPFRVAGENVIRLDPESPREERLTDPKRNASCSTRHLRTFEA
jgi:hypothetical protein